MEEQPGPSRQGYCGYCSLIYTNLEQHVSSAGHRARVSLVSRSSSLGVLMERFLEDVLLHHPHRYADTRPSHGDLSPRGSPPEPRDDHTSCWLPHPDEAGDVKATAAHSQSERLSFGESPEDTPLPPSPGGDTPLPPSPGGDTPLPPSPGGDTPLQSSPGGESPLPHSPATSRSSVHRKCHRKTDRRRRNPPSSPCSFGAPLLCSTPLPGPTAVPLAVVSACSSPGRPQGDAESFHFCASASQRTGETEDWDAPVQVTPERGELRPPLRLGQSEAWRLTRLTESRLQLDDRVYAWRLNSALGAPLAEPGQGQHLDTSPGALPAGGGRGQRNRCVPVEDVRPRPPHIPESFRGKTLEQIERDDALKVEHLVRQFRRGHFLCYFDSESLARCGKRSPARGGRGQGQEATELLPLFDHHDDEAPVCTEARAARAARAFRMASRCQVVKVSHGTQTAPLVVPAVRQPAQSHPPLSPEDQPANRQPAESPEEEEEEEAGRLPPCYSHLLTPLQPSTSLLLLLCSPGPASTHRATPTGPAPKRCRRRSRPSEGAGLKVRYQRPPLRWYDPAMQRVLEPRPRRAVARQLFRSLSPDLNARGRRREEQEEEQEDGPPTGGVLRTDSRGRRAPRGRGRRKGGRGLTPGRGRGRRPERGEASSRPQPRRGGGQRAGGLRKVPGSGGPTEASARSLRVRRKTGCPCCDQ